MYNQQHRSLGTERFYQQLQYRLQLFDQLHQLQWCMVQFHRRQLDSNLKHQCLEPFQHHQYERQRSYQFQSLQQVESGV